MQKPWTVILGFLVCLTTSLFAGDPSSGSAGRKPNGPMTAEGKRIYHSSRIVSPPPRIDGRLDDACWGEGTWSGDYTQYMPDEGKPPTQETELKILYDDNNVYVAIRAHDTEPERIDRRLGRRDAFEGDIVGVCFDSYFDHRTGFEFDLTASGAKIDLVLLNTGWDTSWDPVWEGAVGSEPSAWVAEMRIPLSQLRYSDAHSQVWGLHAWRWISRNREEAQWNLIGRNSPGHLYSIGELHGIEGIRRKRHVELLPYGVGKIVDPAGGEAALEGSAGFDGKVGINSAFTLDFTVNPDFGQVEADPSVLNITAFETFFEEKRPFFLEGKNIFDFPLGEDLLFYSRRIGQAPGRDLGEVEGTVDIPASSSILGALKLTGKTRDGLSVGMIESITMAENATVSSGGMSREEPVEPSSNFVVARIQKDLNQSNTIIGGMATYAHRSINDVELEFLPNDALVGGFDLRHHWKQKTYFLDVKGLFSSVRGTPESMLALQEASSRYYQRPDAGYVDLDPTRTGLSGSGGQVRAGRGANGPWRFSGSFAWRTPGFELNDLGYLRMADVLSQQSSVGYIGTRPVGVFREYGFRLQQESTWNFGGEFLEETFSASGEFVFSNKWGIGADLHRVGSMLDTRLQRGGPAVRLKGFWSTNLTGHSDYSRAASFQLRIHSHSYDDRESSFFSITPGARFRLTDAFLLSGSMDYSQNRDIFQYVAQTSYRDSRRDLVGRIDQDTLGFTLRLDWALTPRFTIQYYGNPFVSTGLYSRFKRFTEPRSADYATLYHQFEGSELGYDPDQRLYSFDEDGDGVFDYSLENPDFNFREFRSNLVARWEYLPGSVLYLVWTQGRSIFDPVTNSSLHDNLDRLFSAPSENVFLVKLSYWLPL